VTSNKHKGNGDEQCHQTAGWLLLFCIFVYSMDSNHSHNHIIEIHMSEHNCRVELHWHCMLCVTKDLSQLQCFSLAKQCCKCHHCNFFLLLFHETPPLQLQCHIVLFSFETMLQAPSLQFFSCCSMRCHHTLQLAHCPCNSRFILVDCCVLPQTVITAIDC